MAKSKKLKFVQVVYGKQSLNFKDLNSWFDYYNRFIDVFGKIDDSEIKVFSCVITPIDNIKPFEV